MRTLKGASLLEVIVAAVLFLTVFAVALELLPRLTVRDDDTLQIAEAEYWVSRALDKYGLGVLPRGEYVEVYDWGEITIRIYIYSEFTGVQVVSVVARLVGSRKTIIIKQLVECRE